MRKPMILGLLLFAAFITPARAGISTLSNVLLMGSIKEADTASSGAPWCSVDFSPSSFERNFSSAKGHAYMTFGQITLSNGTTGGASSTVIAGLGQMLFSTSASGTITFVGTSGTFSSYTQTYLPGQRTLSVAFNMTISGCTLPITAIYMF